MNEKRKHCLVLVLNTKSEDLWLFITLHASGSLQKNTTEMQKVSHKLIFFFYFHRNIPSSKGKFQYLRLVLKWPVYGTSSVFTTFKFLLLFTCRVHVPFRKSENHTGSLPSPTLYILILLLSRVWLIQMQSNKEQKNFPYYQGLLRSTKSCGFT